MEISMEAAGDGFCRLCAKQCTYKQVLDLTIHTIKCQEVMTILSSINITYVDFSSEPNLGKVICLICYDFLIKIQQFLQNVQRAQEQLMTISSTKTTEIKPAEMCSIFEQNSSFPEPESNVLEVSIKIENTDESDDYQHYIIEGINDNSLMKTGTSGKIKTEYITVKPVPQVRDDVKIHDFNEYKGKHSVVKVEFDTLSCQEVVEQPEMVLCSSDSEQDTKKLFKIEAKVGTEENCFDSKDEIPESNKNVENTQALKSFADTPTSKTKTVKTKKAKAQKNPGKKTKKTNKTIASMPKNDAKAQPQPMSGLVGYSWTCTECTTKFESKEQLSTHLMEAHGFRFHTEPRAKNTPITEEHLTCKTCNKVFPTTAKLQGHDYHHHNPNRKKRYPCYKCGKEYQKYLLKLHLMEHDGIKPFVCQVCSMSFVNDIRLRLHEKVHSNLKPYACTECDKTFRSKQTLVAHGRIHSGEKPYSCQHCGKQFRNSTNLTIHERVHTGIYPFECKHCDKKFSCWGNCNKHMQRIHNTTLAKTKGTPQGKFPLDPNTGEIIKPPDLDLEKWQKQVMSKGKRKRERKTE